MSDQEQQTIDIGAYLRALRKRWWVIALPIVLLTPIAAAVAWVLPPVYSATGRILVESQQIPSDLAQSTVRIGVSERIALIEQRLMTRQNLLDVAARLNITARRGPMSPNEIVTMMRRSTDIRGVRLGGTGGATGVNVRFTADRPDLAAQVANEFVSLLLEQNIRQRTTRAFETSAYFRDEVERLSGELSALEQRIATFKVENQDALPDSLSFRREDLSELRSRVFQRNRDRVELMERRARIEEALQSGELSDIARERTPEEEELARLRRQLVERRTVYSDTHPIVQSLSGRISVLEARVEVQLAGLEQGEGELMSPAEQARRVIETLDKEIADIDQRRASEERRIEALTESIDRTPGVELALNSLVREMEAVQTQYRQAVLKRAEAETGERLEVNQQAERFELIERAEVPSNPSAPNRPVIVAAGFVGSAGLGVGIVLLLELLNRTIRTASELERRVGLRPIVVVPYIRTAGEIRRRRIVKVAGLGAVLVTVVGGLFAIDQFYLPLPLVADRLLDATGAQRLIQLFGQRLG